MTAGSNDYYEHQTDVVPGNKVKAEDLNTRADGIAGGFDKLPDPHASAPTTKGFSEPFVVASASSITHAASAGDIQQDVPCYCDDTGSASVIEIAPSPAPVALVAGMRFSVLVSATCTGATTVEVTGTGGSLGVKSLVAGDGSALGSGHYVGDEIIELRYDGTDFQVVSYTASKAITDCQTLVTAAAASATAAALSQTICENNEPSHQNLLINTSWDFNQEGYTSGVITTGSYGHDMWKSISSASYTLSSEALTLVSGLLGQRNDDIKEAHNKTVALSVVSGTLQLGNTCGVTGQPTISSGSPYAWTLDSDQDTDFITFIAASSAYGIKLEVGSDSTKWERPLVTANILACLRYYWKPYISFVMPCYSDSSSSWKATGFYFPVKMRTEPELSWAAMEIHGLSGTPGGFPSSPDTSSYDDSLYFIGSVSGGTADEAAVLRFSSLEVDARY